MMEKTEKIDYDWIMDHKIKYGRYSFINNICCLFITMTIEFQIITLPIVVPMMEKELDISKMEKTIVAQTFFVGSTIGCIIAGYIGDRYGRKKSLIISNTLCIVFGYLSAYSSSIRVYIMIRMVVGIMIGMNILMSHTYLDEVAFKGWRQRNLVLYDMFYQIFGITFALIVSICIDRIGQGDWRFVIKVSNLALLITVLMTFLMSESIKYQLDKKRFQQALNNINYAIQLNNPTAQPLTQLETQQIINTYQNHQEQEQEQEQEQNNGYMAVLQSDYKINLIFLVTQWFAVNLLYYSLDWIVSSEISKDFTQSKTMQKIFLVSNYMIELICGCIILLLLSKQWTKFQKIHQTFLYSIVVTSGFGLFLDHKIFAILLIKGPVNAIFVLTIIYGPQLFPTRIKGRVLGIGQAFGRFGGILMPFIMCYIIQFNAECYLVYSLTISSICTLIVVSLSGFLKYPDQQNYTKLEDTV